MWFLMNMHFNYRVTPYTLYNFLSRTIPYTRDTSIHTFKRQRPVGVCHVRIRRATPDALGRYVLGHRPARAIVEPVESSAHRCLRILGTRRRKGMPDVVCRGLGAPLTCLPPRPRFRHLFDLPAAPRHEEVPVGTSEAGGEESRGKPAQAQARGNARERTGMRGHVQTRTHADDADEGTVS